MKDQKREKNGDQAKARGLRDGKKKPPASCSSFNNEKKNNGGAKTLGHFHGEGDLTKGRNKAGGERHRQSREKTRAKTDLKP